MNSAALSRTGENQRAASDPAASAWVVANAGSGKTHVLTQRVIRLLLAGADPGSVLCLTFTRTAAAEMSRRVFGRLADWATMPKSRLAAEIEEVQGTPATAAQLRDARRLFARALETPGGLKIQTIHGFCERLLHQFPFEANVPGQFGILDDTAADAMLAEARDEILLRARDDGGELSAAVRYLAETTGDRGIDEALDALIDARERLRAWIRDSNGNGDGVVNDAVADLRVRLELAPEDSAEALCRQICNAAGWARSDCRALTDSLVASAANRYDQTALTDIRAVVEAGEGTAEAEARIDFFLKIEKSALKLRGKSQRFSAAFRKLSPGLDDRFEAEAERLLALAEKLGRARTVQATEALLVVGDAILQTYGAAKARAGLLDFGDLIARTRNLLSRSDATAWILYKLDVRLRHILVDEAQDTSPDQWEIVRQLAEDFFSGEGAVAAQRTIFAVGDDKQSIFGFQGAAPKMLVEMQKHFEAKVREAELPFARRPLFLSFRSTAEVLSAVDTVFAGEMAAKVTAAEYEAHAAHRLDHPGRVVLLPRAVAAARTEPDDWTAALDSPTAAEVLLADGIAARIKALIGTALPSGKIVRAEEVLILTRKRDAFVAAMNRALRQRHVAAAGADRIAVAEHIAVLDLLALADAVLLPEDNLQLAALLKSPLFGWSDDGLMALAPSRPQGHSLLSALRDSPDEACRAAVERLRSWQRMADQVTPFRFFATVLGPDGGRRAFRSRLGGETDDVLDAFLSQALAYERTEPPSLSGFAAFIRKSRSDIKREGQDVIGVRVMTVHGAKGLEADVVFLVDTGGAIVHSSHRELLVELPDTARGPAFLWRRYKGDTTEAQRNADAVSDAEADREYFRLLYVAMTRARDVLYIAGIRRDRPPPNSWYPTILEALAPDAELDPETGELAADLVWPPKQRDAAKAKSAKSPAPGFDFTSAWLFQPAPTAPAAPEPLRPSGALAEPEPVSTRPNPRAEPRPGPAQDHARPIDQAPARSSDQARRRGILVHRLLQSLPGLPESAREAAARRFLDRHAPNDPELTDGVLLEASALIHHSDLADVFGPASRAELPIVGTVRTARGDYAVSGQIDRLFIDAKGSWQIVDFKTDRDVPASADAVAAPYILQLALYRKLLQDIGLDQAITATLAYSAGPKIIPIPPAAMDAALARLGVLETAIP